MIPENRQIEPGPVEDQPQLQTVVIVSRPLGFFGKAVAVVAALLLFTLAFVFSLIFIAVLAAAIVVILAYAWWASRRARGPRGPRPTR